MLAPRFAAVGLLSALMVGAGAQPASTTPRQPPTAPAAPAQEPPPRGDPIEDHPAVGHPAGPAPVVDWPKAKAADVGSIDAIIAAYYEATSGAPGEARDWDRFRSLFLPEARMIPARPGGGGVGQGGAGVFVLPISDYIEQNRKYFERGGFFDREASRRVEAFGNIAQVWSVYESRRTREAPEPYSRGINSIQLLKDGERWWIVTVFWDFERPPNTMIPQEYLTPAGR